MSQINTDSLLKAASFTPFSLQQPNAWVGHLPFAAWVIKEASPKVLVELGTHSGNSYFTFCQSVQEHGLSTKCYAVDTWQGDAHAGQYDDSVFNQVDLHNQEHYAGFSRLLRMTFDEAVNYFADGSIDLLHIDGLHTYEAVRHDFETWLPKLAPGAIVTFHDTNVRERDFGVWKLWEELQLKYPNNLEFTHSNGLGVLQLNNAPDNSILPCLKAMPSEKLTLIKYFSGLGSTTLQRFELKFMSGQLNAISSKMAELHEHVGIRDEQVKDLKQQVGNLEQQVGNLEQQVGNLTAEQKFILASTSWRITRPFRVIRRLLFSKSYFFFRKMMSDLARNIWIKIPLSINRKILFKNKLFSSFPLLFRRTEAYRSWTAVNSNHDAAFYNITNQAVSSMPEAAFSGYVPLLESSPPESVPVKLIAFYLPQFHEISENNAWWGEGFTEWTNVKPAQPQFEGHYQPRTPDALGYYNLLDSKVQQQQIELAKLYGVGGFCFYTYWFGGKLLLEKPIENYLGDSSLQFPFCLCWANENWSRRWDGLDSEILIAQNHSLHDDLAFIEYISKYMKDARYIRISGKPLLLVYRPHLLPNAKETAKRWRKWCMENGVGEIYLAYTQSFEVVNPNKYGFDAAVEFPPNNSFPLNITQAVKPLNPNFGGIVYDWRVFIERSRRYRKPNYKLFRGVCPSWDNTARRKNKGTVFLNSTPQGYQEWLHNAITETCSREENQDERLVFINAWNEWAEGAYLEPDQKYGYAYLNATRNALIGKPNKRKVVVVTHDAHPHGAQFLALGLVRSLKQDFHFEVEVVLLGKGRLVAEFSELAPLHDLSDVNLNDAKIAKLASQLVKRGFTKAIVNTTVSGSVTPVFHEAGIDSVCLVHELPGVIQSNKLENQAKKIALYSKAVVFPAQIVADGFSQFASVDLSKQVIRPQGLYRRNKWRFEKSAARAQLRKQLGFRTDSKIVLSVGYADHRKGVDLFVECALKIVMTRNDVEFIWVGHWEPSMQKEVEAKLLNSPYKNRIHFVGFNSETALFHAASDVYALTSREDPFPNVVLESFDAGVPVLAFEGTGGAASLVQKVGGVIVPAIDVGQYSDAICHLLDNDELSSNLGADAQSYVDEHFAFRPYLFELCHLLGIEMPKISVVVPNYNYAQYIEQRLASIRHQSIPIYELIILDDSSTDESRFKISNWLATNHVEARVIINQINSGNVFSQWQKGVSIATGDYIWIAEADDLSEPDFLDTVLSPFLSGSVVLSYCDSKQINSHGVIQSQNYQDYLSDTSMDKWCRAYIENGDEECKTSLAILNTIPNVSAVLFKREILKTIFDQHMDEIIKFKNAGDWLVYVYTLSYGSIAFSPSTFNLHRRHDRSVIGGGQRDNLLQEIISIQDIVAKHYNVSESVLQQAKKYRLKLASQFSSF